MKQNEANAAAMVESIQDAANRIAALRAAKTQDWSEHVQALSESADALWGAIALIEAHEQEKEGEG